MRRRTFLQHAAAASTLAFSASGLAAQEDAAKTPRVRTVLGPIDPAKLGLTLMHEHAPLVDWSELYETAAADFAPIRDRLLDDTARQLTQLHECVRQASAKTPDWGPGAIVECTPIRVGRYPELLVALARRVPVHVIACTGFWCEAMAPQHPWALQLGLQKDGVDRLAELFLREIREGMEDPTGKWGERFTSVKVGIIKVATSTWMRPSERRCHQAAAIASRDSGCPITTHTTDGGGLEQAQLLIRSGALPERIIIGHQGHQDDRQNDEADLLHLQVADLGCFVQFDRVGGAKYGVDKVARQIQRLVAAGHAERVLVGHDHVPFFYRDYTQERKSADGFEGKAVDFTIVPRQLTAALEEAGLKPDHIRQIMVDNPRRVLAF